MKRKIDFLPYWPIPIFFCLMIGSTVFGQQAVETKYVPDSASGTYRGTLTTDDAADLAAVASIQTITVNSKQNIRVSARFSVSAATCNIVVVRCNTDSGSLVIESHTVAACTASNYWTIGGRYSAQELLFDTGGCQYVKVLVQTISSGNVTLFVKKS